MDALLSRCMYSSSAAQRACVIDRAFQHHSQRSGWRQVCTCTASTTSAYTIMLASLTVGFLFSPSLVQRLGCCGGVFSMGWFCAAVCYIVGKSTQVELALPTCTHMPLSCTLCLCPRQLPAFTLRAFNLLCAYHECPLAAGHAVCLDAVTPSPSPR